MQSKIDELEAQLRDYRTLLLQDRNEPLIIAFRLSPSLAKLMGLLLALPKVTTEMVEHRLEIVTDAKVAIHRLRAKLKKHGITIESQYGVGYWISPEHKELARKNVAHIVSGSIRLANVA